MHRALLSAVLSLSVLLSTVVAAQDAEYTFTTIDVPDAIATLASGINTAGQITGQFTYGTGDHGFLKDGATFTPIDVPSAIYTIAFGINDNSQIVGWFSYGDGAGDHGFLKDGATFTPIDVPVPSGAQTRAWGINTAGQIVGAFSDAIGRHGFLKDGSTFTTIGPPGAVETEALGINAAGQIVGWFADATKSRGFLKDGDTFTVIDVPGSSLVAASGINAAGQIVGWFADTRLRYHGFLIDGDTFATIDVPGAFHTHAYGINAAGQIVGQFADATGTHGFLATPIVDTTSPVITVTASPATLRPPNGQLVSVTVSGTITDEPDGSGVSSATYTVVDEYGQIQLSGSLTLVNGEYAFSVALQASRRGNDQDGRHYTIEVSATDHAGNPSDASATVTVPRN